MVLLSSCFDHYDQVSIDSNGMISLTSTIKITDEEADKSKVKEEIELMVKDLKKAGWDVSYKWVNKSKPYKIEFLGTNTIDHLYQYQQENNGFTPSGVWIDKKFSDKQYVISFDKLEDANNRIIDLKYNSLSLYRPSGEDDIEEFRKIESDLYYYLFLD